MDIYTGGYASNLVRASDIKKYKQRSWLLKFDMAVLITNTPAERLGGLANYGGACYQDTTIGKDFGTVIWTDDGAFTGVPIAAHEMAHKLDSV